MPVIAVREDGAKTDGDLLGALKERGKAILRDMATNFGDHDNFFHENVTTLEKIHDLIDRLKEKR